MNKPKRIPKGNDEQRELDKLVSCEIDYWIEEEHIREIPIVCEGLAEDL